MSAVICPHCKTELRVPEIAKGWCATCNTQIPAQHLGNLPSTSYRTASVLSGGGELPVLGGALPAYPEKAIYSVDESPDASRISRLGAALLDFILVLMVFALGVAMALTGDERNFQLRALLGGRVMLAGVISLMAVQIILLSTTGQTIGKKLAGIRIVSVTDGSNAGFIRAVLVRWILPGLYFGIPLVVVGPIIGSDAVWKAQPKSVIPAPVVSAISGLVDVLFIFREDRRCLHDFIAFTKVIDIRSMRAKLRM